MQISTTIRTFAIALATSALAAACAQSDPGAPRAAAALSGVVTAAAGATIEGASVKIGSATATTGAGGRFELQDLPGDRLRDLAPGMAHVAVPQRRHRVDVAVAGAVDHLGALAAYESEEVRRSRRRAGERVQQCGGRALGRHGDILPGVELEISTKCATLVP